MGNEEEIFKELNELSGLVNEDIFRKVKILDDKYQKDNIYYENIIGALLNISEHRNNDRYFEKKVRRLVNAKVFKLELKPVIKKGILFAIDRNYNISFELGEI